MLTCASYLSFHLYRPDDVSRNFDGVMVQSTQAHRLSRKSYLLGGQKLQLPVLCAIFKAHLEDGKDISDYDVLAEIAESCKVMSKEEVGADSSA
jgi:predicted DsbA family dithiol-disulfide isomerase